MTVFYLLWFPDPQLTANGRLGTVGPMQTPVQFLVAKERERGLEHARAITHHRDMAGKRVGERAQKVMISNAVKAPVLVSSNLVILSLKNI